MFSLRLNRLSLCMLAASASLAAHAEHSKLETVLVTATRDTQSLSDIAASVGVLDQDTLEKLNPTHAAELMNRIPGVNIVQLGSSGEGVAAAIRQPVSYGPVYLYLENGVPTRSAGFFNHNALYEVNSALGNGVEIIKGPGSALYGSDAIGAVVNSLSGQPPEEDRASLSMEVGEDDWTRLQWRGAAVGEVDSYTLNVSASRNGGWRDNTAADRQELLASWFHQFDGDWQVNSVFSASRVNMETGGSALGADDYHNTPERAGNKIGFRDVSAVRVSSAFDKTLENGQLSVTPYLRSNRLAYIATWTLNTGRVQPPPPWCPSCPAALDSQDAHINDDGHDSLGILLKLRRDIGDNSLVITGVDIDQSFGGQTQYYIERNDNDPGQYWLSYRRAGKLYDYKVAFTSISPYVHSEFQLAPSWRLTAGLRYDAIRYDYEDNIDAANTDPNHLRPEDQSLDYHHVSPKLGLIYDFSPSINGYLAYRHAFRIPSSGQLFRSGSTVDSTELKPVQADSLEVGVRGNLGRRSSFEVAVYTLRKEDDILSVQDAGSGARRHSNAGETRHRGIEVGVEHRLTAQWDIGIAYSRNQHRFEDWRDRSGDFSGNTMPDAPSSFSHLHLNYHPAWLGGGFIELEASHQGAHWIDESNADDNNDGDVDRYKGHSLLNLRGEYAVSPQLTVYTRVMNLADKRYAETTSKWGPGFTPGRGRTAYLGARMEF